MRPAHELKRLLLDPRSTHYAVLGVAPGNAGDPAVLKSARRELALLVHPDRNPDDRRAHDYTARVNVAYGVLSDGDARRFYDAQLRSTHLPCVVCSGAGFTAKQRGFKGTEQVPCNGPCKGWGWVLKENLT